MVKVGIAGGGRGAELLLNYFPFDDDIQVAAIFDIQQNAPGIVLARQMGVEILPSLDALATKADLDVIIGGDRPGRRPGNPARTEASQRRLYRQCCGALLYPANTELL